MTLTLILVALQFIQVACVVAALVLFIKALTLWQRIVLRREQEAASVAALLQKAAPPAKPPAGAQPHLPIVLSLCDPFGNEEHEINMMSPVGGPPPTTYEYAERQWRYHETSKPGVHQYRRTA